MTGAVVIATLAAGLQMTAGGELESKVSADAQRLYRASTCMFEQDQTHQTLLNHACDQASASSSQEDSAQSRTAQRYVLYGDSIAAHLYPGLLSRIPERDIIQLTGGACRAIRRIDSPRCREFYDWFVGEYVPNHTAQTILVSSSWLSDYVRLGDKDFRAKLDELFERLQGNRVLVYSMAASLKLDVPRYHYKLETFGHSVPATLEMETDDLSAVNSALREEAAKFGFEFIDIGQWFCTKGRCMVAKNGDLYFADARHLTLPGSVLVADATYGLITGTYSEQPFFQNGMSQ